MGSCFQQGAVGTVVGVSVLGEDVEPERGLGWLRVEVWLCGHLAVGEADHIFGVLGRPFCGAGPT